MFAFRSASIGAVCLLFAEALTAAPSTDLATSDPSAAMRQTPSSTSISSLQGAVRALWDTSPEVQAARAEVEAARARARAAAQPLYNPELSLDAENADVNRRTAGLGLTLDLSGKGRARSAQGEAAQRAREAGYDLVRRNVATRWLKAWFAAALAGKQNELGRLRVALMQRFDDLAELRLKVGDISSPERDLAGLALGEAQIQQATLASNAASARAALLAISDSIEPSTLPAGMPPLVSNITPLPADELPELVEARAQQDSAEAGVQAARRNRIPDPTVRLTGGQVRVGPVNDRVIGLSVSIPLPVLNTGRADVEAARAEADAAIANLRARQLLLKASQQETRARYTALREASQAFRAGRAAAFEERTALLEKLWRAGEIGTSDYLVQLKQSLDTALSGFDLESQTWQAWFDYLAAAGRLTDWIDGAMKETSP
ncbi:MAG: TolC family protein [Proteobacteria bacterium]|jgi:cobalt-zinc-cadmium efflux system outer membrane protein|nr:TolC family protein [Pseudomonadota bacterium]